MKNSFLIGLLLIGFLFTNNLFAQTDNMYAQTQEQERIQPPPSKVYLGISTGINNFNGMFGANAEFNLAPKASLIAGVGIGGWGSKLSGGFRGYKHFPKGFVYSASFSTHSGIQGYEMDLETTSGTQTVEMDLHRFNTLNFTLGGAWPLGKSNIRFHFEGGYSLPITVDAYDIVTPGVTLSEDSEAILEMMSPGGIILSLGISFGV